LTDEVIQGRSQIVNCVSDVQTEFWWRFAGKDVADRYVIPFAVEFFASEFYTRGRQPGMECELKLLEVIFRPIDL